MFSVIRIEVESRFAKARAFFSSTDTFDGENAAMAKGVMFVQVYAIYEYTVKSVTRTAIDAVNAHKHQIRDISPALLAIVLDAELNSLRKCSEKTVWEKRLHLFQRAFSSDQIVLNGSVIPHDGSHFRYTQLEMIFKVFGINRLAVRRKAHIGRIMEVVDHRNLIAHGTEPAESIGRRYTRQEIFAVISQMRSVCLLLISVFDSYCADVKKHRRT
jgi:hypothetical protein